MYQVEQKVIHALYGLGTVEKIEEKSILGKLNRYAVIAFHNERMQIMVNLEQKSELIREPIAKDDVPKILDFLKECKAPLPVKSPDRFNINMNKIKSADIYKLVEVIKDLAGLAKEKKLTPKELSMLKQSQKMLCNEMCLVSEMTSLEVEDLVERYSKC